MNSDEKKFKAKMLNTEIQRLTRDDLCSALVFVGIYQFNLQSSRRRLVFFSPDSCLSVSGVRRCRSRDSMKSSPRPLSLLGVLVSLRFTPAGSASCLSALRAEIWGGEINDSHQFDLSVRWCQFLFSEQLLKGNLWFHFIIAPCDCELSPQSFYLMTSTLSSWHTFLFAFLFLSRNVQTKEVWEVSSHGCIRKVHHTLGFIQLLSLLLHVSIQFRAAQYNLKPMS